MDSDLFQGTPRFAVSRRLGAGASGVVYEAWDAERQAAVALKTLQHPDPVALYRFKQEFRAHADLSHPNLVQLHELMCAGDQWFFTMELVPGTDIITHARDAQHGEGVTAGAVLPRLFRQLAQGLSTLHGSGTLHRDIKPSNVLVTPEGRVVLLDFGLAFELAPQHLYQSMERDIVGTPIYMAPEQAAGLKVTEATDWYGVGAILYEALVGAPPFEGALLQLIMAKHQREPTPVLEAAPEAPPELARLCDQLLRRDPERRPDGVEVLRRLGVKDGKATTASSAPSRPTSPLVGREEQLQTLRQAYAEVQGGNTVVVFVHGGSGMGKSMLAGHFLRELRQGDSAVVELTGRCYQNESVPYKAFDSLVDALTRFLRSLPPHEAEVLMPRDVLALARLFPVLRRVDAVASARRQVLEIPDSHELRRRAFGALRELLARLAERRTLVLLLDDLQWGDVDSASLLAALLAPPDPPPLLLACLYRDVEASASPFLQALLAEPPAGPMLRSYALPVGQLGLEQARDLARTLLGSAAADPDELSAAIARESLGNPLFIDELVRYALSAERSAASTPAAATSLDQVLRERVAGLPAAARELLEVLVVAGQPVELEVAKRAAGLSAEDHAMFAVLRLGRLARAGGGRGTEQVETYHDRVREAVLAGLPADTQARHHRQLGRELEAAGDADPEALAHHFAAGGEPERATDYAARAADRAAEALAFDRAARLYRVALELAPAEEVQRRTLRRQLGDALVNAGRGGEAAEAYLAAAQGAQTAEALEMRRRAAEQLLISGHIDEGLAALKAVLASVGMALASSPRRALVSLVGRRLRIRLRGLSFRERDPSQVSAERLTRIDTCWSAAIGLGIVDTIRGSAFQARHLLLALRAGEPYRVARALAVEVGYSATRGGRSRDKTARLIRSTFELVARTDDPHALGLATMTAGLAAYLEGRWRSAREQLEQAEEILRTRCTGVAWELDNAHFYSLRSLVFLGEIRELLARLPAQIKEAQERGDLYALTNIQTRVAWLAQLARDRPEAALGELQEAIDRWSQVGFHLQHFWGLVGRVETALYRGEGAAPWELLAQQWRALERSLLLRIQGTFLEAHNLRGRCALAAAASTGPAARETLLAAAEASARAIAGEQMPWSDPLAALLRGGVAERRGEVAEALRQVTAAEGGFTAANMALWAAVARSRRGELVGGAEGEALSAGAQQWMAGQGIVAPRRLAAAFAPGPAAEG